MDAYPSDLLAGVAPLVFAVDAILAGNAVESEPSASSADGGVTQHDDDDASAAGSADEHRDLFFSFLEAVSQVNPGANVNAALEDTEPQEARLDPLGSLLQQQPVFTDDAYASSDEDETDASSTAMSVGNTNDVSSVSLASHFSGLSYGSPMVTRLSAPKFTSPNHATPGTSMSAYGYASAPSSTGSIQRLVGKHLSGVRGRPGEPNHAHAQNSFQANQLAFSAVLKQQHSASGGANFLHRARIVPVSRKHAFPPSKDPSGVRSRIGISLGRNTTNAPPNRAQSQRVLHALESRLPEGILPSGWLEKHVHALASVVVVVCRIHVPDFTTATEQSQSFWKKWQDAQNTHTVETLDHLQSTMSSKRDCRIHLVCLATTHYKTSRDYKQNEAAVQTETERRVAAVRVRCNLAPTNVSVIVAPHDLEAFRSLDENSKVPLSLKRFHKNVRDASMAYYLAQARRARKKYVALTTAAAMVGPPYNFHPEALPLVARYCFKVAIFYEFQGKAPHKSVKFFTEAYRTMQAYHRHLALISRQQKAATATMDPAIKALSAPTTIAPTGVNVHVHEATHDDMDIIVDEASEKNQTLDHIVQEEGQEVTAEGSPVLESSVSHVPPLLLEKEDQDMEDESGGMEVALMDESVPRPVMASAYKTGGIRLRQNTDTADMIGQCLYMADWLNFKLLQMAFGTSSAEGLVAASAQWRRHVQSFLQPLADQHQWQHWSYIKHQRLVMSQLTESHPADAIAAADPNKAGSLDEAVLVCTPWRHYAATAEATLRLGSALVAEAKGAAEASFEELEKDCATATVDATNTKQRQRFVGGLDSEGLEPQFCEEMKHNHNELAYEYVSRAMTLLDRHLKVSGDKLEGGQANAAGLMGQTRSLGRLHYLAGGILFQMKRFGEAMEHLERAGKLVVGWKGLELSVWRLMSKCMNEWSIVEGGAAKYNAAVADGSSFLLFDSATSAKMSPNELRSAYQRAIMPQDDDVGASTVTTERTAWSRNSIVWPLERKSTTPFSFSVTFPKSTHATAGDVIPAILSLKSALTYPVKIKSIQLSTTIGMVPVPLIMDASVVHLNKDWESKRPNGMLIVRPNATIFLATTVTLPSDVNSIPVTTPGKKYPTRSRSAGVTRAAGASFIVDPKQASSHKKRANAINVGGGATVSCDGIALVIDLDQISTGLGEEKCVELTLDAGDLSPSASTKYNVDEEAYLMMAWARPQHHPYALGPRSVRVHGPIPQLKLTNVTALETNGKVMDGTVNRIIFKLEAHSDEECHDMKFSVTCTSMSSTEEPVTNVADATNKKNKGTIIDRPPMLVVHSPEDKESVHMHQGYELPKGFQPRDTVEEFTPILSHLKAGDTTYIYFDIFRPLPLLPDNGAEDESDLKASHGTEHCQSTFELNVQYRQGRKAGEGDNGAQQNNHDVVTQKFSGVAEWFAPLAAEFSIVPGKQGIFPSGSRNPSNIILEMPYPVGPSSLKPDPVPNMPSGESSAQSVSVVDGNDINIRCSVWSSSAESGLTAKIKRISFEEDTSPLQQDNPYKLSLISPETNDLYVAKDGDLCSILKPGTKLGFSYVVHAKLSDDTNEAGGVALKSLGRVSIDWSPMSLSIPDKVKTDFMNRAKGMKDAFYTDVLSNFFHGPLPSEDTLSVQFGGPTCLLERSPFEAILVEFPSSPKVNIPFDIMYCIANKTSVHQKLTVSMSDVGVVDQEAGSDVNTGVSIDTNDGGVLVSGMVSGELHLAPFESRTLDYTALATRAGKIPVPALLVSSVRHRSWVIRDARTQSDERYFFVLP